MAGTPRKPKVCQHQAARSLTVWGFAVKVEIPARLRIQHFMVSKYSACQSASLDGNRLKLPLLATAPEIAALAYPVLHRSCVPARPI